MLRLHEGGQRHPLISAAATRYAPEVVALLDDEDFCRDLKETLDETRKSVYLEVYHVKR